MPDTDYIHSFTKDEQERLMRQAQLLEPHLHRHIDLSGRSRLLEIGCGVGAQLRILSRRHPGLHLCGVDVSQAQIQRAHQLLADEVSRGLVDLHTAPGDALPFADGAFDAVYICFVLEHVPDAVAVVREARRVLADGGVLYCTEVFNDALYVYPPSPAIMRYWRAFNTLQAHIAGDPNIGIRLCNLMIQAGLAVAWLKDASYMLDQRMTDPGERATYLRHWLANFDSARQRLLAEGAVDAQLMAEFDREFEVLRTADDAVFLYSNRQVCAHKPLAGA